jgi:hypothetical protein
MIDEYSDKEIVNAILKGDSFITKEYLYRKCYPLFASIYYKYYTDCENVFEFINEIYLYILTPRKATNRCKLADFGFRCTLTMWLKVVSVHYCNHLYAKKMEISENLLVDDDRKAWTEYSLEADFKTLNMEDVKRILMMMPNERYRRLIEYHYLEEKSNEETALLLMLSMANYYNVHLRAKAQFCSALRKEGLI